MVHILPRQHVGNRQAPANPIPVPTLAGVSGAATIDPGAATATSLAVDVSAGGGQQQTAPPLAVTTGKVPHAPSTTTEPQSPNSPSSSVVAQSNASRPISMTTVLGACIGAFIGASIIISIAFMFYRRYSRSLKSKARTFQDNKRTLNSEGGSRSRPRQENWNRLDDGEDRWEGQYQTKEIGHANSMENLTMFKKATPSVKTYHSEEQHISTNAVPQSLAESLAQYRSPLTSVQEAASPVHSFLGRVDTGPPLAWDSEPDRSFLSFHSARLSGGAISPTLAIPTPVATLPPHWGSGSAEVVSIAEAQSAVIVNPFDTASEHRKSHHNPFFSAQDYSSSHKRSQSSSSSARSKKVDKGKGRAIDPDPFDDANVAPPPVAETGQDRALQSLIAALDIPASDAQERLRIASMQPSIVSAVSAYSEADDDDMTEKFPLPPSSEASHGTATHVSS